MKQKGSLNEQTDIFWKGWNRKLFSETGIDISTYIKLTRVVSDVRQYVFKIKVLGLGIGIMSVPGYLAEIHVDIFGLYVSWGIGFGW